MLQMTKKEKIKPLNVGSMKYTKFIDHTQTHRHRHRHKKNVDTLIFVSVIETILNGINLKHPTGKLWPFHLHWTHCNLKDKHL